ncbi:MAG: glycosyltransferase [Bacillota bacterium]|nr:glycosyltransferase [Bacillota bacterium]
MTVVSIIVPIYNAEKYLNECIDSIINQSYTEIEIILINDGSTDKSDEICKRYKELDKRIKYIYKENEGVSIARNTGIKISTGEWITFLDADDKAELNMCERFISNLNNSESDIYLFNHYRIFGNKINKAVAFSEDHIERRADNRFLFQLDLYSNYFDQSLSPYSNIALGCVWGNFYKSTIIKNNNLYFNKNLRYSEDYLFTLYVFQYAKSISYNNEAILYYRILQDSSAHVYKDDWVEQSILYFDEYEKFILLFNKDKRFRYALDLLKVSRLMSLLEYYYFHPNNPKSLQDKICELANDLKKPMFKSALHNVKIDSFKRLDKKILLFLLKSNFVIAIRVFLVIENYAKKVIRYLRNT